MDGKIIIDINGDTARVEMWRSDEGTVSCARFTTAASEIMERLRQVCPQRMLRPNF